MPSLVDRIAPALPFPQHVVHSITVPSNHHRIDVLGAIGIATSLGLVLVPLILGREQGWPVWGFVLMVLRFSRSAPRSGGKHRQAEPVLDVQMFCGRALTAGLPANAA